MNPILRFYCWIYGWALTIWLFVLYKKAGIDVKSMSIEVSLDQTISAKPVMSYIRLKEYASKK